MGYLEETLRGLEVNTNPDIKFEVYRRFYLTPKVWFQSFEGEERDKARSAFGELIKNSYELDIGYASLIADGLEDIYEFPSFIKDNYSKWLEVVRYLAYGNSEIERSINKRDYEKSREAAMKAIQSDLLDIYNIENN
jgi:hypothetical protein